MYNEHNEEKESITMKGYYTSAGFYGLIDGRYVLFSGEAEYYEYMEEDMADPLRAACRCVLEDRFSATKL